MSEQNKSFEQNMQRLEQIVRAMERGEVSLEESLKLFSEGTDLVRSCGKLLDEAELQVKKIVAAALKTAGHYIDVEANVLYTTPTFNKKSQIYGTAECSRMNAILAAFPSMTVKVQSKDRKNNAITYAMMEEATRDPSSCSV